MKRVYYYDDYDEDVVHSRYQDRKLPKNYQWLHNNISYMIYSKVIFAIFWVVGWVYMRAILRVKVVGREKLRVTGYFLIGNHTQPQGDVFGPAMITWPRRPYYIVAPANLGVPVVGRLLPGLGAIVIPGKVHEMTKFRTAVKHWVAEHPVVIYPEAHVWPYYTGLRPMKLGAFQLAVEEGKEIFTMTITYQKRRSWRERLQTGSRRSGQNERRDGRLQAGERRGYGRRPRTVVYIDGPFRADPNLSKKQAARQLREEVRQQMEKRCRQSDVEYVKYVKGQR